MSLRAHLERAALRRSPREQTGQQRKGTAGTLLVHRESGAREKQIRESGIEPGGRAVIRFCGPPVPGQAMELAAMEIVLGRGAGLDAAVCGLNLVMEPIVSSGHRTGTEEPDQGAANEEFGEG
jgi:hypothetical protein